MEFKKAYDRGESTFSPAGEKIVPTYSLVVDKDTGKQELKETGKTNIYDYIQESLESTLVYNIIERYNSTGDASILDKVSGFYGNVMNMPKNLAEAQQIMINANHLFNSLPVDERAKYNHSLSEFLSHVEKDAKAYAAEKSKQAILAEQRAQIQNLENNNTENNGGDTYES